MGERGRPLLIGPETPEEEALRRGASRKLKSSGGQCCSWHQAMQVLTLVIVILAVALVGVSVAVSTRADSLYRACVETTPTGEATGAKLVGTVEFDSYDSTIRYTLQQAGTVPMSDVQALRVRGPVAPGDTDGPILVALCGAPNLDVVCDTTTTPDVVAGLLRDATSYIQSVRNAPHLYYVEGFTSAFPAGAFRAALTSACGFP